MKKETAVAKTQETNISGHMALWIAAKQIQCQTDQGKLLLLYYAGNANKQGWFFKSYEMAEVETGISRSTILRYNKKWSTLGLMSTVEPEVDSGKATEYQMNLA